MFFLTLISSLIFLSLLFRQKARKTTENARIVLPTLGKKGKTLKKNKEFLAREKRKEKKKEDQGLDHGAGAGVSVLRKMKILKG